MSFAIVLAGLCVAIYLLNAYFLSYWRRRNFPQAEPSFLIGNCGKLFKCRTSFMEFLADFYEKYKHEKVIGIYLSYQPALIINDPVIIQQIMIKDFGSYHDRPLAVNEDIDPLSGNLFFLKGQKWRELRVKFSPLFTTGKLKVMYPVMRDCGEVLRKFVSKNVENGNDVIDFKDLFARFTINIISSIAFGIEIDSINERDHIFRKMGIAIFTGSVRRAFLNLSILFWPNLFEKLKMRFSTKEMDNFFSSLVSQTVEYREKNNVQRNDFMDLMIQLKNMGYVSADKDNNDASDESKNSQNVTKLTMNEITAQAFVFYAAGFETSSSTMSFCLFELCKNQEIQRKVQEEIDEVLASTGTDEITYDALQQMKYLECCVDEALRKYPVVFISRAASRDTKIPTTDLVIEKGVTVYIPVLGIQRDPEIYEDPLEFKPERFLNSSNGSAKIKNGIAYSPFGDGPRNCIGARLGKLQAKLGIALILSKYNLELADKKLGEKELEFDIKSGLLGPREKLNFRVLNR